MTEAKHAPEVGGSAEVADEIVACAERTLAEPSARIEFRQDWSYPKTEWPRRRRRRGGFLRPVGRLAKTIVKAAWKRATRDLNFGHMIGKGILEPTTGRFMIGYGSFAQIHTDGKTFGGRSGRCLETLDPFPTPGHTEEMLWLLRLLWGATDATLEGEKLLHRTPCKKLGARVDMARASAASDDGLRTPAAGRFEELRALPRSVWIDAERVRRIEFEHESRQLMLELWDFGVSADEFDRSRLPTSRSPEEAADYAGESRSWYRRALRRFSRR
jgi:hypothetical protein